MDSYYVCNSWATQFLRTPFEIQEHYKKSFRNTLVDACSVIRNRYLMLNYGVFAFGRENPALKSNQWQ